MIEATAKAVLGANAAVVALLGDRVFPVFAPDDAVRPYAVYQNANTYPGDADGEYFTRLDIEIFPESTTAAPAYGQAIAASAAVERALEPLRGLQPDGVCMIRCQHVATRDTRFRASNQHGRRVELLFNYVTE